MRAYVVAVACVAGFAGAAARAADTAPDLANQLGQESALHIETIRLEGNRVFSAQDLAPIVAPYEHRDLHAEDLEDLRVALTRHYVDAGYINSGAVIPEQSIAGGVLTVHIVEGTLTAVAIAGAHHYRAGYLEDWFAPRAGAALNMNQLQERMQLALQDGALAQVNAELVPGDEPGQSTLKASVREGPRFAVDFGVANDRPVSVGEIGGTLALSSRNLFGDGEGLSANFGVTDGYTNYGAQAHVPVFGRRVALFGSFNRDHGSVVESALEELDITSRESSGEAGISVDLVHSMAQALTISTSFTYSRTETFVLGIPFSFTPGVEDGLSKVAAVRSAVDWTWRAARAVLAARAAIDVGVDAFDSTVHDDDLPDSQFVALKLQAQYVRQLTDADQVLARMQLQLTPDGLLPAEKIAVGGMQTVRGYRENFLVRDNGGSGSLEYRRTLLRLPLPGVSREALDGALAGALFADFGAAHDHERGATTSISSAGAGLRWAPSARCSVQVYKGFPLQHTERLGSGLQDHGVHFAVAYGLSF
jgi:hemolysin activation/secretion protein